MLALLFSMVMGVLTCLQKQIHELLQEFHCLQYLLLYDDVYGDVCVSILQVMPYLTITSLGF
jgi:hypothetical protein